MKWTVLFALGFLLGLSSVVFSDTRYNANSASPANAETLVLYDAASGTLPGSPLMNFTDFPPDSAPPVYDGGATVLDTTTSGRETYAGWTSYGATAAGFPLLDRTAGFQMDFTVQVESESHRNNNRAGFNVILLGADARGIELAFWEDEIWAQSDDRSGGLFQHGEGVAFATTAGLVDYRLTVLGDIYTLSAHTVPVLSGPVRDYSPFDGFPDPYESPNFLFLGDNTTSAQARVRLGFVSVTGGQLATPTAIPTITSTSSPLPVASSTSTPSATPLPTPAPSENVPRLCAPGWIVLPGLIILGVIARKIRAIR